MSNFGIGVAGAGASMLITVLRTALLTKSLSLAEYGGIVIVQNLYGFAGAFLGVRVADLVSRFFPEMELDNDEVALRDLLWGTFLIALSAGVVIALMGALAGPWIARSIYDNSGLGPGIRVYAISAVFTALSTFTLPILRLRNRFAVLHIWQNVGALAALCALAAYLFGTTNHDATAVLAILAGGTVFGTLIPLVVAAKSVNRYLLLRSATRLGYTLYIRRAEFLKNLFQTNLAGYLKSALRPGDTFILGVLSSPQQVAVYSVAVQLVWPLTVLNNNSFAAATPEIVILSARKEWARLLGLCRTFLLLMVGLALIAIVVLFFVGQRIIELLTTAQYVGAWSVTMILACASAITLVQAVSYPVGLALDRVGVFNLALILGIAAGFVLLVAVGASAVTMGCMQLTAAVVVFLVFSPPIAARLVALARSEGRT